MFLKKIYKFSRYQLPLTHDPQTCLIRSQHFVVKSELLVDVVANLAIAVNQVDATVRQFANSMWFSNRFVSKANHKPFASREKFFTKFICRCCSSVLQPMMWSTAQFVLSLSTASETDEQPVPTLVVFTCNDQDLHVNIITS
jgi:hypothetical protein